MLTRFKTRSCISPKPSLVKYWQDCFKVIKCTFFGLDCWVFISLSFACMKESICPSLASSFLLVNSETVLDFVLSSLSTYQLAHTEVLISYIWRILPIYQDILRGLYLRNGSFVGRVTFSFLLLVFSFNLCLVIIIVDAGYTSLKFPYLRLLPRLF